MIRKTRSASFLDAPPPRQATERELGDTRTSGNGREHRDRKAPKITVNSAPGKPLNIDMQPIDAVRLMSAFVRQKLPKALLPLVDRLRADSLAVEMEKVKQEEDKRLAIPSPRWPLDDRPDALTRSR